MAMTPAERKSQLVLKGKSMTSLAEDIGVSISMVSRVVSGEKRSQRVERYVARILGKPVRHVFEPQTRKVA